ncbi:TylF/MycF/NovP-related O-methyltransferase [Pseudooceanicola sp.]|uniref:TylF/MycF/NovP-related O-methyltransferase n=1 Tax=Pseudooceanicola sp. TaxID=1914328 RepID=UPI0026186E74|nr:TylF/MycF/NovP-related O-methyltransferase [Pseudooceanicola sp.]MDF1856728.1 macrocin O-methyltransferase [Pseudooceanicola sp.]
MFYGNFKDGRGEKFIAALALFKDIFGAVYANDNLIGLQRSTGFLQDPRFKDAMRAHSRTKQEASLGWRLHTLCWAAGQALKLKGDFVECGVLTGFSMGVVSDYVDFVQTGRRMYLYDTFEGIPEAYNSEARSNAAIEKMNAAGKETIYDIARLRFADTPNVQLVRGIVPDSFAEACPDQIAFLHIDMNSAASEIAALEALYDRVVPGGYIVFDDYGWTGYAAQKHAEDDWLGARGQRVLELPTGQGLVVKLG